MRISNIIKDDTGQMYTLEALATAIMMLFLITFIVQASPLTPLTSSSSHQQVETYIETIGSDLLIVLDHVEEGETNSALKKALINWNGITYHGQYDVFDDSIRSMSNVFNMTLIDDGIAYNLVVAYLNEENEWKSNRMFWNGESSDNAIIVTRKVAIHNKDNITALFIPDLSNNSEFFNILDVRLTLWRM